MFNATIYKQSVRKNYKLWSVLTGVICFFACMIAFLANVNPDFQLPGSPGNADLITIYAGAFYGMMGLLLFIIYTVTVGNKLVVSEVDKGDLSFTLNTPVSRKEVIFSKAAFYITSIMAMVLALCIVGAIANAIMSPGKLDYTMFFSINFVMFCFLFAISGISFAASCWFNKSGSALIVGAGIPIAFFLFNTIAGFGSEMDVFKYFTLNTLFSPIDIIAGENFILNSVVFILIGVLLYGIGIVRFLKKDLPL
jgi:ABC-2 type transport system permease protein